MYIYLHSTDCESDAETLSVWLLPAGWLAGPDAVVVRCYIYMYGLRTTEISFFLWRDEKKFICQISIVIILISFRRLARFVRLVDRSPSTM